LRPHFLRQAAGGGSPFEYLGSATDAGSSSVAATVDVSGLGLQEDDILVYMSVGSQGNTAVQPDAATGFTVIESGVAAADDKDFGYKMAYRVMGSTPISSFDVSIPAGLSARRVAVACMAFRGVDTATPLDVASVEVAGGNTADVDPGAITPVTDGALILCGGGGRVYDQTVSPAVYSKPSAFNDIVSLDNGDTFFPAVAFLSYYTGWVGGAYDPPIFTPSDDFQDNDSSWVGITAALRPA